MSFEASYLVWYSPMFSWIGGWIGDVREAPAPRSSRPRSCPRRTAHANIQAIGRVRGNTASSSRSQRVDEVVDDRPLALDPSESCEHARLVEGLLGRQARHEPDCDRAELGSRSTARLQAPTGDSPWSSRRRPRLRDRGVVGHDHVGHRASRRVSALSGRCADAFEFSSRDHGEIRQDVVGHRHEVAVVLDVGGTSGEEHLDGLLPVSSSTTSREKPPLEAGSLSNERASFIVVAPISRMSPRARAASGSGTPLVGGSCESWSRWISSMKSTASVLWVGRPVDQRGEALLELADDAGAGDEVAQRQFPDRGLLQRLRDDAAVVGDRAGDVLDDVGLAHFRGGR